jgi:transcriptional regulator with XRE-family HTH domain
MRCPVCKGTGELDATTSGLGYVVAARREEIGMTQAQLSAMAELSRTSIANIEAGRQSIKLEQVRRLASALNLPPESLLP